MRRAACWVAALALGCGGSTDSDPNAGTGAASGAGATSGAGAGGGSNGGSGGAAIGGSGGAANGGSGGAAIGGSGGAAIGGSGGMASAAVDCRGPEDCRLFEDCCSCAAVPRGEMVPQCRLACGEQACSAIGIGPDDVTCIAGRCTFAQSCNEREVDCPRIKPECPPGHAPVVHEYCYTGACIPITDCSQVTDCSVCDRANLSCVTLDALPTFHCVETPRACAGNPTCECMGVCMQPFICADPASRELACTCPVCG